MRGLGIGLVALLILATLPLAAAPTLGVATFSTHVSTIDPEDCGDGTGFKLLRGGVKWKAFPVSYRLDLGNFAQFANPIRAGLNTWDLLEHPAGDFFEETMSNEQVLVTFAPIDGEGGTLATATISFTIRGKEIVKGAIVFDSDDAWATNVALTCGASGSPFDVESVMAHEAGHIVGLQHSQDSVFLTLYPFYSVRAKTLATGDVEGFAELYADGGDDGGGKKPPKKCHPVRGCP